MAKKDKNEVSIIKGNEVFSSEDWYQLLVEDCQSILVERGFRARMEVVEGKWEIGKRITEENEGMKRENIYGKKIVENLSNDLGTSTSNLFACVQFYKQLGVDDFEKAIPKLPGGKETSWYKISQEFLGNRKEKAPKQSYKLKDIIEVLKGWLYDEIGLTDEKEIDDAINNFKDVLINQKTK